MTCDRCVHWKTLGHCPYCDNEYVECPVCERIMLVREDGRLIVHSDAMGMIRCEGSEFLVVHRRKDDELLDDIPF